MSTKSNLLSQLEDNLGRLFIKTIPYQIPDNYRALIVKYLPYLAVAGGIVSVFGLLALYRETMLINTAQQVSDLLYPYAYRQMFGDVALATWVAMAVMFVQAIISFMAFSPLKKRQPLGWKLLYWSGLLSVAYSLINLIWRFDVSAYIGSLIAADVGLYVIFQLRDYYREPASSAGATPSGKK